CCTAPTEIPVALTMGVLQVYRQLFDTRQALPACGGSPRRSRVHNATLPGPGKAVAKRWRARLCLARTHSLSQTRKVPHMRKRMNCIAVTAAMSMFTAATAGAATLHTNTVHVQPLAAPHPAEGIATTGQRFEPAG